MKEVICEQTDEEQTGQLSIAQMVQHCSANAEAMSSNPAEVPVSFLFFFYLQLLKLQLPLRPDDHIFI